MDVYVVTGASKGIGFELFNQLQAKGHKVIGIARTVVEGAENFVSADLGQTNRLDELMTNLIEEHREGAAAFTLINNAGIVEPIGLVGDVDGEHIENAIAVNLTAPMRLSNAFMSTLKDFEGAKRIVNISSGAGRNPYEGWGTYCATKAGLDHFSRVVAVEQESAQNPVEIISIAPGIIDTDMQVTIRASGEEEFPLIDQFINYKEQGLLSSAEETASKLISLMETEDFIGRDPIVDIRNY